MTDREKVINALGRCELYGYCEDKLCPYYEDTGCLELMIKDALGLLKEQPKIVRCKDCKHRPTYPKAYGAEINGNWCYWCELHRSWKTDDWFCADGERR
jgi:hypothetical protein